MRDFIGKPKSSLDTPCLVIDKNLLQENIKTMQYEVHRAKKQIRPHVKTHKCTQVSAMQIAAGAIGICAAKISEAYVLAQHGFKKTLVTSPVVTHNKLETLVECLLLDPELMIVVDNLENVQAIHSVAKSINQKINVLIDVDPHVGRTGIAYPDAVDFAQALQKFSQINLLGIQCYAGNLQHITDYNERRIASNKVMREAAKVKNELYAAGLSCEILSGSGTGTYDIDMQIPEVTEVQPGSYTMMDAEYSAIQSSQKFKPALTLLTTIISVNHHSHVTCDAGWKALYEVPTKPIILKPEGFTYAWSGDEHGKIAPIKSAKLPVLGDHLELMAAHCDPTINMYDVFYITENDIVVDIWPIDMRGKSQ